MEGRALRARAGLPRALAHPSRRRSPGELAFRERRIRHQQDPLAGELAAAHGEYRTAFARYEQRLRGFVERNQRLATEDAAEGPPPKEVLERVANGITLQDYTVSARMAGGSREEYVPSRP